MSAAPRVDPLRRTQIPLESGASRSPQPVLHIAIVTDDAELAAGCERILLAAGHTVWVARHSGHAHLLSLSGERIDVLLVEIAMADGSGPSLMRRMRRHNAELRSIYLARAGTRCDAENVLVRPFTADDLLGRVVAAAHTALST